MNTNGVLASYYVLQPGPTSQVTFTAEHKLAPSQTLVLGHASLGSYNEHANAPAASAFAGVKQFVQGGVVKNVIDGSPIVIGPNITDIIYAATASKCWARTSFVTLAFS
jgi:hypothetical protein